MWITVKTRLFDNTTSSLNLASYVLTFNKAHLLNANYSRSPFIFYGMYLPLSSLFDIFYIEHVFELLKFVENPGNATISNHWSESDFTV